MTFNTSISRTWSSSVAPNHSGVATTHGPWVTGVTQRGTSARRTMVLSQFGISTEECLMISLEEHCLAVMKNTQID
jgi:hypothetical protein